MPSNGVATSSQSITPHRRSTASSKQRENRPQTPVSGPSRRRRSRSPDVRMADDTAATRSGESGALRRKKKSSSALSAHSSNVRSTRDYVASDEVSAGKSKHRHRPHSQVSEEQDVQTVSDPRQSSKNKRRERSRSREPSRRTTPKAVTSEASGDEGEDVEVTSHSHGEYSRMKKELEDLRKVSSLISF